MNFWFVKESQPDLTKSVLFHGVTYLGSTSATAPRSEEELHRYREIPSTHANLIDFSFEEIWLS